MDKDRLDRQIEFIREIDKEKSIGRQTYLADASRKEDDAEHAWHMAIMTVDRKSTRLNSSHPSSSRMPSSA